MNQSLASPPEIQKLRRMWVVWLLFFFQYGGIGVFFTFLNVYFHQVGLSGTQIGLLNMIASLLGVAGSAFWGYLSDRTGKPRLMISAGAAGALLAAQFIPYANGFWVLLLLGSLGSFLGSAPSTLVDSTTLVLLGNRREEYGRYRLGGSIGYIVTALSAGFIYQQTGLRVMFPAYAAVMGGFALVALLLPPVNVHIESRSSKEFGRMMRQPAWLVFIASLFLCMIAFNAAITFQGVLLNAMGANQSLIGEASTIGTIIEIPFMFFSGKFLRRFGPVRLLIAGMVLLILRFFLLGWMPAPEWAVAINILNGPAFVFFWNSAVTYANQMAPPGMAGTAQGLLVSTTNLSGVVGSLLAGWLFDRVGPNKDFVMMGFLVIASLILFSLGSRPAHQNL